MTTKRQLPKKIQEIIKKHRAGKRITNDERSDLAEYVWHRLGVYPKYGKDIEVYTAYGKRWTNAGLPKGYTGMSYRKQKGLDENQLYINTSYGHTKQMQTYGHETSHLIMGKATKAKVGEKKSEDMAFAGERVFMNKYEELFGVDYGFEPHKGDLSLLKKNVKKKYTKK